MAKRTVLNRTPLAPARDLDCGRWTTADSCAFRRGELSEAFVRGARSHHQEIVDHPSISATKLALSSLREADNRLVSRRRLQDHVLAEMARVARESGAVMALRRRPPTVAGEIVNAIDLVGDAVVEAAGRFLDWLSGEPAETLARAHRGELTRRSARTPLERRAVNRATYERRRTSTPPGESVRSRLGHGAAPLVTWSEVPTTAGLVELTTRNRTETRRVAQFSRDVRLLLDGALEPAAFRRRWTRRVRIAGGFELEADPDVVLVLRAESGPPPDPYYRRHVARSVR